MSHQHSLSPVCAGEHPRLGGGVKFVLLCCWAVSLHAQTLRFTNAASAGVFTLTRGMDYEVFACGVGTMQRDTSTVVSWTIPGQMGDTAHVLTFEPCPKNTVAVFHNHPWTGPAMSQGMLSPKDLCALSRPDEESVVRSVIPWAVVGVGRWSPESVYVCWWPRLYVDPSLLFTPSSAGRRLVFTQEVQ